MCRTMEGRASVRTFRGGRSPTSATIFVTRMTASIARCFVVIYENDLDSSGASRRRDAGSPRRRRAIRPEHRSAFGDFPGIRGRLTPERARSRRSPGSASAVRPSFSSSRPTPTTSRSSLQRLNPEIPVTVIGVGSNLLVRDGGIAGVVIRLSAKGFGQAVAGSRATVSGPARRCPTSGSPPSPSNRGWAASHSFTASRARSAGRSA